MSHASVLVAVSPEQVKEHGGLHGAIAHQMEPFDEAGEWFKDGSRWDWWCVGGRFAGQFAPPGYDPTADDRNKEPCFCCQGTGRRDDAAGLESRRANPNYTCNGCGGSGKSLKHASEWVDVGNVTTRAGLDPEAWKESKRLKAEAAWAAYEKALAEAPANGGPGWRFGVQPGDTKESYVKRRTDKGISFYAFLRNREWHEVGRMGFFGGKAATECEVKAEEAGVEPRRGRCITKDDKTGAKVFSWNKSEAFLGGKEEDVEAEWYRLYFDRFLKDLPPDTILACVDYHV